MQHHSKNFYLLAGPLLLILFIDGMGLGLVFPVLNALIVDPVSSILPVTTSVLTRNILYGSIVSCFMICWFFGAAFLGDLSDQIGRKKALMICLIGGFLGYLFSSLGAMISSISMLVIGRVVAGFTSGSQSIAQAAIVDISTPETKARNIGMILLAVSLGFIVGPLLAGFLSDNHIVSWFNFWLPFAFAAILSFVNAILLHWLFKETFQAHHQISVKWHRAIEVFISAFRNSKVRALSCIFLIMLLGWSSFYSFISMYLLKVYHLDPLNISLFMAVMGLGFGVGTGILVDYLTLRYPLKFVSVSGLLITAVAALIVILTHRVLYDWLVIAPLCAAIAVAYSVMLTIFSNQVDEESQGWVMGITGAIMAFSFGISGIVVGLLASFDITIPMILAVVFLGSSAVLMIFWEEQKIP